MEYKAKRMARKRDMEQKHMQNNNQCFAQSGDMSTDFMYQLYPDLAAMKGQRSAVTKKAQQEYMAMEEARIERLRQSQRELSNLETDIQHINREVRSGDKMRTKNLTEYEDLTKYRSKYGLRTLNDIISDAAVNNNKKLDPRNEDDEELVEEELEPPRPRYNYRTKPQPDLPRIIDVQSHNNHLQLEPLGVDTHVHNNGYHIEPKLIDEPVHSVNTERPMDIARDDLRDQPALTARIPAEWNAPVRYSRQRPANFINIDDFDESHVQSQVQSQVQSHVQSHAQSQDIDGLVKYVNEQMPINDDYRDLIEQPRRITRTPSEWNAPVRYTRPQSAQAVLQDVHDPINSMGTHRAMQSARDADLGYQPSLLARIPAEWNGPTRYHGRRPASFINVDDFDEQPVAQTFRRPARSPAPIDFDEQPMTQSFRRRPSPGEFDEQLATQSFRRPASSDWAVRDSNKLLDATDRFLGESTLSVHAGRIETDPVRCTIRPLTEQNDFRRPHSAMAELPLREHTQSQNVQSRTWRNVNEQRQKYF